MRNNDIHVLDLLLGSWQNRFNFNGRTLWTDANLSHSASVPSLRSWCNVFNFKLKGWFVNWWTIHRMHIHQRRTALGPPGAITGLQFLSLLVSLHYFDHYHKPHMLVLASRASREKLPIMDSLTAPKKQNRRLANILEPCNITSHLILKNVSRYSLSTPRYIFIIN